VLLFDGIRSSFMVTIDRVLSRPFFFVLSQVQPFARNL
jgi:hypothetical protein